MKQWLKKALSRLTAIQLHFYRESARQRLLQRSDRFLRDAGISRDMLEMGTKAWPWQHEQAEKFLPPLETLAMRNRAIKELEAYSDRELQELGIARTNIVDVVENGRPGFQQDAA